MILQSGAGDFLHLTVQVLEVHSASVVPADPFSYVSTSAGPGALVPMSQSEEVFRLWSQDTSRSSSSSDSIELQEDPASAQQFLGFTELPLEVKADPAQALQQPVTVSAPEPAVQQLELVTQPQEPTAPRLELVTPPSSPRAPEASGVQQAVPGSWSSAFLQTDFGVPVPSAVAPPVAFSAPLEALPPVPWTLCVGAATLPFWSVLEQLRAGQLPNGVSGTELRDLSFIVVGYNWHSRAYFTDQQMRELLPLKVTQLFKQLGESLGHYEQQVVLQQGLHSQSFARQVCKEFIRLTAEGTLLHGVLLTYAGTLVIVQLPLVLVTTAGHLISLTCEPPSSHDLQGR